MIAPALALVLALPQAALGQQRVPAEVLWCRDLIDGPYVVADEHPVGLFSNTARLYLTVWRLGMTPGDGDRCGMFPSCSTYTLHQVRTKGPVLGAWLGAARIMADHRDPDLPLCRRGRRLYRVDLP